MSESTAPRSKSAATTQASPAESSRHAQPTPPLRLEVALGERTYPLWIGRGLTHLLAETLAPYRQPKPNLAVVTDHGVRAAGIFSRDFTEAESVALSGQGETLKNLDRLGEILESLARRRIDRQGCLVALGGGVVGDLAGFAAATYLRGIAFIQVPTTLLAMVDSSVGGKTGINLAAGKNLAGAFWQPRAVFIDLDALATLPPREFAAGMAEVIKYGLLADADLYATLLKLAPVTPDSPALPTIIHRCCAIKATIVADDERETDTTGGRALLNLGHTFAHAIEAVAGYGTYLHGEAVAIGLSLAARLSHRLGLGVSQSEIDSLEALLTAQDLPTRLDPTAHPLAVSGLIDAMSRDKKVLQGNLRFIVLKTIGDAKVAENIPATLISDLWKEAGAK